jgi:hypothetical protein
VGRSTAAPATNASARRNPKRAVNIGASSRTVVRGVPDGSGPAP